jgi:hypothetical protein
MGLAPWIWSRIRIELTSWIRIRIATSADPRHWLEWYIIRPKEERQHQLSREVRQLLTLTVTLLTKLPHSSLTCLAHNNRLLRVSPFDYHNGLAVLCILKHIFPLVCFIHQF